MTEENSAALAWLRLRVEPGGRDLRVEAGALEADGDLARRRLEQPAVLGTELLAGRAVAVRVPNPTSPLEIGTSTATPSVVPGRVRRTS